MVEENLFKKLRTTEKNMRGCYPELLLQIYRIRCRDVLVDMRICSCGATFSKKVAHLKLRPAEKIAIAEYTDMQLQSNIT